MTSPVDRVARTRSLVEAFNRHDVARSVERLAATVTWSRGDGASLQGRDNLAVRLGDFFTAFPDASLTPTHMLAVEPHAVVVEWVLEGTHLGAWRLPGRQEPMPPTGRAVRVVGADLFGFNPAGEIVSDEARIDVSTLLTQINALAGSSPEPAQLRELAARYTASWGSQDAASVAAFYSPNGSLSVNGGAPAVGLSAITEVAQGFMTAFPDMEVLMDGLLVQGDRAV
jgi:predicted ester cyclase